jgi:hypothetical protein
MTVMEQSHDMPGEVALLSGCERRRQSEARIRRNFGAERESGSSLPFTPEILKA